MRAHSFLTHPPYPNILGQSTESYSDHFITGLSLVAALRDRVHLFERCLVRCRQPSSVEAVPIQPILLISFLGPTPSPCFRPSIFTAPPKVAPKLCTSDTKLESSIRIAHNASGSSSVNGLSTSFALNIVNPRFPRSLRFASTRWCLHTV
jgi:hypothetical protein